MNLVIIAAIVTRYKVFCVCISYYSIMPIPLKLSWSDGAHVVWILSSDFLGHFFSQNELSRLCDQSKCTRKYETCFMFI